MTMDYVKKNNDFFVLSMTMTCHKKLILPFTEYIQSIFDKLSLINYTFVTVGVVNFLAFTGDTTATWTSPMFMKLNSTDPTINPIGRQISVTEQSLIGSILNIGGIIGSFPFGWFAHKYGRKAAILAIALPHLIAFLIYAFPVDVTSYYVGRFISGIAAGGGYALLPMYVGEVAEDSNRGKLTASLNIFWTFGNCFSLTAGPFLSATDFNLLLACFPVCFFILFLIFAPESPYYLVGSNNIKQAENSLMLLRSETQVGVQDEIRKLKAGFYEESEATIFDLFKSKVILKSLILSVVLLTFQQLSGINIVLFYAQPIFEISGSTLKSEFNSVILGVVLFLTSFTAPFVVDKCGRRMLLIISNIGIFFSLSTFGVYFYVHNKTKIDTSFIGFIPITSLVLFLLFFNIGVSPVPWTLSSELFPSNVKSVGTSSAAFVMWTSSFFLTNFFNDMVKGIDMHGTFWMFAGFSLTSAVFVFLFLPETRGKSFGEIQKLLEGRTLQWPCAE